MTLDLSPRGIATILAKNFMALAGIFAVILTLAFFYFLFATNVYQSRATLLVRFGNDVRPELELDNRALQLPSSRDERREIIESYLRILQSREYAQRLVREFGVEVLYPAIAANGGTAQAQEEGAVATLRDAIVVKSGTQTNVLEMSIFHPDPELARQILARLIDMYISTQADLYENPQIEFIRTQMEGALAGLSGAQKTVNEARQKTGIFSYEQQFSALLAQKNDIATNLLGIQAKMAEADGRQERLKAYLGEALTAMLGGDASSRYKELQQINNQIEALRASGDPAADAEIAAQQKLYQEKLREVQALNKSGSSPVQQQMLQDYLRSAADSEASRKAIDYWRAEEASVADAIQTMQRDNQSIVDLTRNVELAEGTYRALKRQFDDASVSQNLNDERITRVTVIDAPYVEPRPARPRKFLILLAALVASTLISAVYVVLRETLSDRVFLPDHLEDELKLKVISSFDRPSRQRPAMPAAPAA